MMSLLQTARGELLEGMPSEEGLPRMLSETASQSPAVLNRADQHRDELVGMALFALRHTRVRRTHVLDVFAGVGELALVLPRQFGAAGVNVSDTSLL